MDQQWQVCELEESSNTSLTLFERFSVSPVPESWIMRLKDGTLVCFWPSVNPGRKIRSLHYPKVDEKCVYYKCRILLDGAKYSTYKEAKEAELLAQNFSSIIESSVLESQIDENICESTMDFEISDADIDEIDKHAEGYGFDVTSLDDEETDVIVGNDSFEYNKAMLKERPSFSKKAMAMAFKVENIADKFLPRGTDEIMHSDDNSDYSANFINGNLLTSTVIDEELPTSVKSSEVSEALLKISAVELKLSNLVTDILIDLNKSKEILRQMENGGGGSNATEGRSSVPNNNFPLDKNIDEYPQTALNDSFYVQREKIGELPSSQPTVMFMDEIHYDDVLDDIQNINETFVAKSVDISDTLNSQRPEILNIEIIPAEVVPISGLPAVPTTKNLPMVQCSNDLIDVLPILCVPAVPITEIVPMEASVQSQPDDVIRLPVNKIESFITNEDLLGEEAFDTAMVKHLRPRANENATSYMNRTILTVFTENFFLDNVAWRKQPNRINMKNSNLLSCWMESCREKFDGTVNGSSFHDRFQDHFRRFKSALRASIKKKTAQRKVNGNLKSKKM